MSLDRSIKPVPADEISFSLPDIQQFNLENELRVLFVQKKSLPILQMNLLVDAGSKFDPENKKGLANLFAMALDEGAGQYNALELSDEFDLLGTHFNVQAGNDDLYISLQTLTENFDRSLELFSTVITRPRFEDSSFEREQRKILTRIMQVKDDPEEIADTAYEYLSFGKINPYAYPVRGYENDVKNISNQDIKKIYTDYFTPNRSTLIVVGDIIQNELIDKLNHQLNCWRSGGEKISTDSSKIENKIGIYIADKKASVQSEIRLGHLTKKRDPSDYFPKLILNTILGGQFSSRINLNLREKHGYTYGASSRFNYYRDNAYFVVSTSVGIENTADAIKEIVNELKGIRKGITSDELEFAKSSIIRKFPSQFETYRQIASNLMAKVKYSLPDDYFNTYLEKVKSVTIDDVNRSAVENISSENLLITVVGDKEKLSQQFSNTGLDAVTAIDINGKILTI